MRMNARMCVIWLDIQNRRNITIAADPFAAYSLTHLTVAWHQWPTVVLLSSSDMATVTKSRTLIAAHAVWLHHHFHWKRKEMKTTNGNNRRTHSPHAWSMQQEIDTFLGYTARTNGVDDDHNNNDDDEPFFFSSHICFLFVQFWCLSRVAAALRETRSAFIIHYTYCDDRTIYVLSTSRHASFICCVFRCASPFLC